MDMTDLTLPDVVDAVEEVALDPMHGFVVALLGGTAHVAITIHSTILSNASASWATIKGLLKTGFSVAMDMVAKLSGFLDAVLDVLMLKVGHLAEVALGTVATGVYYVVDVTKTGVESGADKVGSFVAKGTNVAGKAWDMGESAAHKGVAATKTGQEAASRVAQTAHKTAMNVIKKIG